MTAAFVIEQEEVLGAVQAVFSHLNGRPTAGMLPHEPLLLCSAEIFPQLAAALMDEIVERDPSAGSAARDVAAFADARGYDVPAHAVFPHDRACLLWELCSDVLALRLKQKKPKATPLTLPVADPAALPALRAATAEACAALGQKRPATAQSSPSELAKLIRALPAKPSTRGGAWIDADTLQAMRKHWDGMLAVVDELNEQYAERRRVMLRRLGVTLQALLHSPRAIAHEQFETIAQAVLSSASWREELLNGPLPKVAQSDVFRSHLSSHDVSIYHVLGATRRAVRPLVAQKPVRRPRPAHVTAVRNTRIGAVPDRGGVVEGYSREEVLTDIAKTNAALQGIKTHGENVLAVAGLRESKTQRVFVGHGVGGELTADDVAAPARGKGNKGKGDKGKGKGDGKAAKGSGADSNRATETSNWKDAVSSVAGGSKGASKGFFAAKGGKADAQEEGFKPPKRGGFGGRAQDRPVSSAWGR